MKKILIVEDDDNLRRVLWLALEKEGYRSLEAASAEAGLELLRQERPDLILLDVILPGMSGVEMCRKLRKSGSETAIILMSVQADVADRVAGLSSGANDFVAKPFSLHELLARVRLRLRPSERS